MTFFGGPFAVDMCILEDEMKREENERELSRVYNKGAVPGYDYHDDIYGSDEEDDRHD